ncbi:MAG: hypothetical protein N4A65_07695 [Cohaesibacter sp.]|jgi:hypothetical protein|nr:hypothetical protein [Cohaesibacter sp.]
MMKYYCARFARLLILALVLSAIAGGFAAKAQEHAYTKLDEASCLTLILNEEEAYSQQVCKGYDGIALFISEGDIRISVSYRSQKSKDGFFSFTAFNTIGNVMEWRLKESDGLKVPYATILRWHVQINVDRHDQILVITKLEEDKACVAAFVDASANAGANEMARDIADHQLEAFRCGQDAPQWYGKSGPAKGLTRFY